MSTGLQALFAGRTSASTKTLPMALESTGSLHEDPAGPHAPPRLTHRQERLSERLRSHFRLVRGRREVGADCFNTRNTLLVHHRTIPHIVHADEFSPIARLGGLWAPVVPLTTDAEVHARVRLHAILRVRAFVRRELGLCVVPTKRLLPVPLSSATVHVQRALSVALQMLALLELLHENVRVPPPRAILGMIRIEVVHSLMNLRLRVREVLVQIRGERALLQLHVLLHVFCRHRPGTASRE